MHFDEFRNHLAILNRPRECYAIGKNMAQALKIHAVVSGKTLTLSDLGAFEGKRVEVTVTEEDDQPAAMPPPGRRELGLLRGKLWVAEDFDAPLPHDVQKYFDDDWVFEGATETCCRW